MRRVLPLIAVLLMGFAPVPFPKSDRRSDAQKMQGKWARVALTINGEVDAEYAVIATILNGRMSFGTPPSDTWKLTLHAAGTPKRIDFHCVSPIQDATNLLQGVYRLEGDTLTICWRAAREELGPATSFDPAQPFVWLQVFKRQKP